MAKNEISLISVVLYLFFSKINNRLKIKCDSNNSKTISYTQH